MNRITHASLLTLTIALAACGGGGNLPQDAAASQTQASAGESTTSATPSNLSASGSKNKPAPAPASSPTAALSADKTCGLANFQQEVLDRMNQARAVGRMCGSTYYNAVGPMTWNSKLFDAAAGHAQDMAANNNFSHTSLDGRSFSQRITDAGYVWSAVAENIAAGQSTVAQAMDGWLQSAGHCANIMNGNYTEIGVACARNDAATYKQYWAMELGHPR